MTNRWARSLVAAAVVSALGGTASAYPIPKGTSEIRPLIGVTASLQGPPEDGQPNQFQIGVDWLYSLNGPLSLVIGGWAGFGEHFVAFEFLAGVKYRFLNLHPRVAPFVLGGGGFTVGFYTEDPKDTVTGLGFRFGGGVDFFATPRVIPGLQIAFDLGPRFSPSVGFLGSVQITFGCSFLL